MAIFLCCSWWNWHRKSCLLCPKCPKWRFLPENFANSEKSRTFVATIPTTPLSNAYHGGTSFLYKEWFSTMATYTNRPICKACQLAELKKRGLVVNDDLSFGSKIAWYFWIKKWFEVSVSTEFICVFVVVNIEYKILQTMYKVTNFPNTGRWWFRASSGPRCPAAPCRHH